MENIPYLLLCDYDLTLFNTKERSPRGIGLKEGYEHAVQETFGPKGLAHYQNEGGLQNRAPSEVVASLMKQNMSLIGHARKKHAELSSSLKNLPATLAVQWKETDLVFLLSEMLVHFKLRLLLGEIGLDWPLPYPGVCNFFHTVADLREREGLPIEAGILSSGHTHFIEKTLSLWGIPSLRVMVTDDDIRPLGYPKDPKNKVKPAPFPFKFLQLRWLKQLNGLSPTHPSHVQVSLPRIMYFGDDSEKDGGLARNVGVPFGWFQGNEKGKHGFSPNQQFPRGSFTFSDWTKLCDFIGQGSVKKLFSSGAPLAEIFSLF